MRSRWELPRDVRFRNDKYYYVLPGQDRFVLIGTPNDNTSMVKNLKVWRTIPEELARRARLIYFMRSGETVKIGFTANLLERMSSLQTSQAKVLRLMGVVAGELDDEQEAHRALRHHKVGGEWFRLSPMVRNYIEHALLIGRIPDARPDMGNQLGELGN